MSNVQPNQESNTIQTVTHWVTARLRGSWVAMKDAFARVTPSTPPISGDVPPPNNPQSQQTKH